MPMRVMIIYEHFSPHQVVALEAACRYFASKGHSLIPLEYFGGSQGYGWKLSDKAREKNWICLFPNQQTASAKEMWAALRRAMKQHKPQLVVANGWYHIVSWWLALAKPFLGVKLAFATDSNYWDLPRRRKAEAMKYGLMKLADGGFVAGQSARDYLVKLGLPSRRLTLGNDVVDNQMYAEVASAQGSDELGWVIGTAARLIEEKNLERAIQAFQKVSQRFSEVKLTWRIAGRGPLTEKLQQLAKQLEAKVEFIGFQGYADMPKFYEGIDLYWQPSWYEPWGLVINEAMASGRPVLASVRCGASQDLITPESGWVHDVQSEEQIAAGLATAITQRNEWKVKGAAARTHISHWGPDRFASGLYNLSELILKPRV